MKEQVDKSEFVAHSRDYFMKLWSQPYRKYMSLGTMYFLLWFVLITAGKRVSHSILNRILQLLKLILKQYKD